MNAYSAVDNEHLDEIALAIDSRSRPNGAGNAEDGDDCRSPAGPYAAQVINDGYGHSDSPQRVNNAQAHGADAGQ